MAWQQSQESESAEGESAASEPATVTGRTSDEEEPVGEVAASSSASNEVTNTTGRSESSELDTQAADELFAGLSSFRETLRNRRLARR